MCHIVGSEPALISGEAGVVLLNKLPLRWGHLLVVLNRHATRFSDLSDEEHASMSALVHESATLLERRLEPRRVFVGSFGSPNEGLAMSSPHLHWHIVPLAPEDTRPSEVFTWGRGVFEGTEEEWVALESTLRTGMRAR